VPEGILSRVWLEQVWLEVADQRRSVDHIAERAFGCGSVRGISDVLEVSRPILIDGELVPCGDGCGACLHERRDDVVECTPKVVYDIAQDDAEAWFLGLVGREDHVAPAGLWIDLRELHSIRARLSVGGLDGEFALQNFYVLDSACEFRAALSQVQIEPHALPLEDETVEAESLGLTTTW
jgi:hypothetical protein